MKTKVFFFALLITMGSLTAQTTADKEAVYKACMGYIEGFYEGDTLKLTNSLRPRLYKYGFWQNDAGEYKLTDKMSFQQAKNYAKGVLEKKNFPATDAPKKVEVLDIIEHIAAAKVTAWWGVDYMLLSKEDGVWMIEEVLWQGPLKE